MSRTKGPDARTKGIIKIIIPLNPVTKKNQSRVIHKNGRTMVLPSQAYVDYEYACFPYLVQHKYRINTPVNVKAVYYRKNRIRVDLCNLHEALCDVLVKHQVVEDDNCNIIATMDGSCVKYDKDFPRTEVTITPIDGGNLETHEDSKAIDFPDLDVLEKR